MLLLPLAMLLSFSACCCYDGGVLQFLLNVPSSAVMV
jgi:hypothetical protein